MSNTRVNIDIKANADLKAATAEVGKLNAQLDQTAKGQDKAAASSKNMGGALLQGSRALQDMQYGLGGVVNNLEGIASALGMGAGVAGVVTVLAVAIQALGPQISALFESLDTSKIKTEGLDSLVTQLQGTVTVKDAATRASEKLEEAIRRENAAYVTQQQEIERAMDLLKRRNEVSASVDKTQADSDIADIKARGLPKQEEARLIAERKNALLSQDFARGQSEAEGRVAAAGSKFDTAKGAFNASTAERQKAEADLKRVLDLQALDERAKTLPAELERARSLEAGLAEGGNSPEEHKKAMEARDRLEQEMKSLDSRRASIMASGPISTVGEAQSAVEARKAEEKKRAEALIAANTERQQVVQNEQLGAQKRLVEYQAQRVAIAREAAPGVYDVRNAGAMAPSPLGSGLPALDTRAQGEALPVAAIDNAAQAFQNGPIDLSPLAQPLEQLANSALTMRTKLEQQIITQGRQIEEINRRMANNRP